MPHNDYSHKTVLQKLGLKIEDTAILINQPESYKEQLISHLASLHFHNSFDDTFSFIQFFTTDKDELEKNFSDLKDHLKKNGMLWISWPKKSSKIESKIDENIIREIGLENGLVDVKVISVD